MGVTPSRYTWMDGELLPSEQAVVPFLNAGLHYGLAVFEGIRCYDTAEGPAVFRLPEHIKRLVDSARVVGLEVAYNADELTAACLELVRANALRACYLRPAIYAGNGAWNLSLLDAPIGVGIAAWEWKDYLGAQAREHGVRANVASFARHHVNVMMTKGKISGNYVNSVLAKTESQRLGFDEAIMLDTAGYVSECTGANLFIVRDGQVLTPPKATILEGITRDSLLAIGADLGHPVAEETLTRDQLYLADEVFVCGTAAEVIGLREIDGRPIGAGAVGPITRAFQHAFHAAVRGEDARYRRWLTPVTRPAAAPARPFNGTDARGLDAALPLPGGNGASTGGGARA